MPRKGYKQTKSHRDNISKANKIAGNTPLCKFKHQQVFLKNWRDPKIRKKLIDGRKQFFKDLKDFKKSRKEFEEFAKFRKIQRAQEAAEKRK